MSTKSSYIPEDLLMDSSTKGQPKSHNTLNHNKDLNIFKLTVMESHIS